MRKFNGYEMTGAGPEDNKAILEHHNKGIDIFVDNFNRHGAKLEYILRM
jgi:hypothetical protein